MGVTLFFAKLTDLFQECWECEVVPQDLRNAVVVSLYKNKGVKSECRNYKGVTLLSIARTILTRVQPGQTHPFNLRRKPVRK